ncbi:hypothetical protein [Patulibacter sp. SYSU D01012]|uniref:hypothetical protein n=1 Tax=Patulibacter sp. SYSU D01012 TaxID=2817381 RepID=UPI001B306C22|nr:hypothetical protein [Patulibacter sp. SYSU D01012]
MPRKIPPASTAALARGLTAVALTAVALAGCGGDDPTGGDASRMARTHVDVAVPAVSAAAAARGVVLEGRERGVRLWLRPAVQEDEPRLRATFRIMGSAPASLRRRLASTSGYEITCSVRGKELQRVIAAPAGPPGTMPVGQRVSTTAFLSLPKGQTAPQAVRWCQLGTSQNRRGSSQQTFTHDPQAAVVRYRFD